MVVGAVAGIARVIVARIGIAVTMWRSAGAHVQGKKKISIR